MTSEEEKRRYYSLWEDDLNRAFEKTKKTDAEMLMNILTIVVFNRFNSDIGRLYKIINNMNTFSEIIDAFSDKSVRFPNNKDLREALVLAIVYYYRRVKNMSWGDIQKELPYEKDVALHNGKKLVDMDKTVKEQLDNLLTDKGMPEL